MPVVRVNKPGEGEGEGEGVGTDGVAGGLRGRNIAPDVARVVDNGLLADHVGRFVAGEVVTQFQEEDLADLVKGKNMIMISGSWG